MTLLMPSGEMMMSNLIWDLRSGDWVEDWENVMDKGDVMRTQFLAKYGGLVFDYESVINKIKVH